MRSIFYILYKTLQEDQLNSRRFPGFPGVVDTLFKTDAVFTEVHCSLGVFTAMFTTTTEAFSY